jgi:fatty acid-binding protein DegV
MKDFIISTDSTADLPQSYIKLHISFSSALSSSHNNAVVCAKV